MCGENHMDVAHDGLAVRSQSRNPVNVDGRS